MNARLRDARRHYTRTIRLLAALFALAWGFVAATTMLHTHVGASVAHRALVQASAAHATPSGFHAPAEQAVPTDCPLCAYGRTVFAAPPVLAFWLAVVLTTLAVLRLMVRLAALCARPAPRRGLRAPPVSYSPA